MSDEPKIKLKDAGYRELVFAKSLLAEHFAEWMGVGSSFPGFIEEAFEKAKELWTFDTHRDELHTDVGIVKTRREGSASRAVLEQYGLTDKGCFTAGEPA